MRIARASSPTQPVRLSLITSSSTHESPFMPRDNDKNNDSRGRRDRPGKGRSGAARGPEKKFAKRGFAGKSDGDKRPYAGKPDGAKSYGKKPYSGPGKPYAGKREGPPPRRDYGDAPRPRGDRPDRPPRFNRDDRPAGAGEKRPHTARGDSKPWQNRDASSPDHAGRNSRPARDGARNFDKPRFDKPRDDRSGDERPRFSRPREDRPQGDRPFRERPKFDRAREDRPKFERPRQGSSSWQEHPRSEPRSFDRNAERPRRATEDDAKVFATRPPFAGRGATQQRTPH